MCGRYYVDDETAREIEKLVQQVDERLKQKNGSGMLLQAQDIHPTDLAPVLAASGQGLACRQQRWGISGFHGKQVIFNARCESAMEKRMFCDCVAHRRIVIPATWFYEWNRNKEKNIFCLKDQPVLFMAGFYQQDQNEERFVILTTSANESMAPVHHRMPLILERDEITPWIFDHQKTEAFLRKKPGPLERKTDYEQMSLFSL